MDNEITNLIQTRHTMMRLLKEHFEDLIALSKTHKNLLKKLDEQIEKGEKINRDYMVLLNSTASQIQETVSTLLPLMKQSNVFLLDDKTDKTDNENYQILDPKKREAISELKEYISELRAKDKEDAEDELLQKEDESQKEEAELCELEEAEEITINESEIE